jgi:CHAT domain-containing protein
MVFKGSQASRQAFEQLAGKCRYLHLSTYGYFADESVPSMLDDRDRVRGFSPLVLAGLAFAGANLDVDGDGFAEGVITAEELASLDLSGCELAVLSACDTNAGVRRAGQGIASLQQALYAAGVRASITSLWKVPDAATQELMAEFYRRLWILGESKAEALWNAQRLLREKTDESGKPLYSQRDWAGWVLCGDPD